MAITWRTSTRGDVGSASPFSVTEPSGAAQNDILILRVYAYSGVGNPGFSTPAGWTEVGTAYQDGNNEVRTYWIRRGASAPSLSLTRTNSEYCDWQIDCVVGVRTTGNPYSNIANSTPGSRANPDPPAVTTAAGETVLALVSSTASVSSTWTPPSGYTIRSTGQSGYQNGSASKDISSGTSENPGAFSGAAGTGTCIELSMSLVPTGPTGYTTTIDQGSYSFTPQNVGTSRTLSYITAAAQVTYSWTAQAVGLIGAYMLASAQTSYAFTPQNVTTTYQPATNTTMVAAQVSYAFTPQDVGVKALYTLPIEQGSYSWTPQDVGTGVSVTVDVYWTQVPGNEGYQIEWDIDNGAPYTYSNTVATDITTYGIAGLLHRTTYYWRVAPLVGGYPYPWSSEGVFTTDIAPMAADYASYSWTPQNIGTYYALAYSMAVGQGAYAFTPQAVATSRTLSYSTTVAQGSYAFTPQAVATTVALAYSMAAGQGSYAFTPQNITTTVARAYSMAAADASYAFTPQVVATQTVGTYITTVEAGAYSLTLQSVGTAWSRAFSTAVEFISYAFTPQSVNTVWVQVYPNPIDQGSYSWTPQNITTTYESLAPLMAAETFGFAYTAMAIGSSTTGTEERSGNAWFIPFFRRMACRR